MKIYLHIGTHKTGTTAIQHYCCEHRSLLARHGLYWPTEKLPLHPHQHSQLAKALITGEPSFTAAYLERAIAATEAEGAQALLLSGEAFSTLPEKEIGTLTRMLAGHDLEIIVYFRNVYDYALSVLTQQLKHEKNVLDLRQMLLLIHASLDYSALLSRWEKHVAPERLQVRCYDAEREDLVANFLGHLGVPAEAVDRATLSQPRMRNESLDLSTQLLLAACGYAHTPAQFQYARDLYAKVFDGLRFEAPAGPLVAAALCADGAAKVTHPRLASFKSRLLKAPDRSAPSAEDIIEYLDRLSCFTRTLARHRRLSNSILGRLGFWR